jgi:hypothetical protein
MMARQNNGDRAMKTKSQWRKFVVSVAASVMAATFLIGTSSVGASSRASFCSSKRTVQSFGHTDGSSRGAVGLVSMHRPVLAGRTPAMRVVNAGRGEVSYGAEFTQRWRDGSWRPMHLPPEFVSSLVLSFVHSESVSKCVGPVTLRRWPAGRYRWILEVRGVGRNALGKRRFLRAGFRLRHR